MEKRKEDKIILGLPRTEVEAVAQIEELEDSHPSDWLELEEVLDRIENRYEVYAY